MANPLTNRKFIHFNKLENFENQLQNNPGSILDTQIVFIKDARKIWTHGTYYTLDERITLDIYSKLEALAGISADIIQKLDEVQFISAGPTADRPTGAELLQGVCYLDTDLNEPIWWDGTNWIDAAGNNADLLHSGTTAQKPSIANVKIGFDYLDTTTGEFFISDGTQWVQFNKPATQTTPGIVQPRHSGNTNKSGLLITDNQGSMQINTRAELGLYIDGAGQLHTNIVDAATDEEIEAGTSTKKALTPSNMEKIKSEVEGDLLPKDPAAGYEYVDLGLPSGILWAKANIGADSEEGYGAYFSWGNIEPHYPTSESSFSPYTWGSSNSGSPYKDTPGASIPFTSQTKNADYSEDSGYDAARELLGGSWRMPTATEFKELYDNTDREWTTINSVNGWKFMKKSDHSVYVFFPATGYGREGSLEYRGSGGNYWSSSLYTASSAYYMTFTNGSVTPLFDNTRFLGFSARAVLDNSTPLPSKLHTVAITGDYNDLKNQPDFVNNGSYNSTTKEIELKHDNTVLATIDATAFIKDGMVDSVTIENGNLVITFNTDAGKQPISIPLALIFNPENYYTKSDIDTQLAAKADLVNGLVPDTELPKADNGTTAGIVKLRTNGQGANRSGLTVASDGGIQVMVNRGLRIDGAGRLDTNLEENGGLEFGSNNGIQMKTATDTDVEEGTAADKALTPANMDQIKAEVEDSIIPDPTAGHEYVEIGGLKWATMNVGAESETDAGLYFQWGDTQGYTADQVGNGEGQKPFTMADYKLNPSGDGKTFTKYNATDGKTVLDLEDDAVHTNWGGSWRLPTTAELLALGRAVNVVWTTNYNGSGINGILCTDKQDSSRKLFFPTGYAGRGSILFVGSEGGVWSSSLSSDYVDAAWELYFDSGNTYWDTDNTRSYGFPVRGILDDTITPPSKLHKVAVSGDYNDLENKPTIPAEVTETTVSNWGFTKNTGTYSKPTGGIPKTDLATDIQTSLGKADTALQQHQDLSSYADGAEYDSTNHLIYLKHGNTRLSNPIDATDFIKDGMIENVTIEIGKSYYLYENAAAAVTAWNPNASLPTEEDLLELRDNTDYEWTTINGVFGGKFINKTDSTKFIFLPALGEYSNGTIKGLDTYGDYLSSTSWGSNLVKTLTFGEGDYRAVGSSFERENSAPLRAVSSVASDGFIDLDLPSGKYWATENVYNTGTPTYQVEDSIVITFNTDSGKEPITIPLSKIFNPDNYYNKGDINLLLEGKVDAVSGKGLSTNDYTTTEKNKLASIENGAQVNVLSDWNATSGDAQILNKPKIPELPNIHNGHEYVDLGLPSGTLWATMNVGAESETDAGLYFQWGDTEGYTSIQVGSGEGKKYFSWADYKFNPSGDGKTFTKYNATDGKTVLDLEDDAAQANWGGEWCMPTQEQMQELKTNTTYQWVTDYNGSGINGRLFTSKINGKTLFISAAGSASNGSMSYVGSYNRVWSNSLNTSSVNHSHYLGLSSSSVSVSNNTRFIGCSVRGVLDPSATQLHKVAVTGDYNDLENKPTPTTSEEVAAGTATNKALTPANLNDILTVLLGKNFGNSNHTIEELFQYVLNQIEPVREFVDLGLPSGKLWAAEDVTSDDAKYIDNGYYYYIALDDNDVPVAENAVALWSHNDSTVSLPTKDDFQELIDNTDYTTVTINGMNYAKFTSKVDATKYITIPMAGYNWRGEVMEFGEKAYTWTSTPLSVQERRYYNLEANTTSAEISYGVVPSGHILRAIKTEPIPVEGDVQIFLDPECTQYATGVVDKVYARVNVPWGFGEGWHYDAQPVTTENSFIAYAPDNENPSDPYSITLWVDYMSDNYQTPFEAGQIVPIAITDGYDLSNCQTVFTRPS